MDLCPNLLKRDKTISTIDSLYTLSAKCVTVVYCDRAVIIRGKFSLQTKSVMNRTVTQLKIMVHETVLWILLYDQAVPIFNVTVKQHQTKLSFVFLPKAVYHISFIEIHVVQFYRVNFLTRNLCCIFAPFMSNIKHFHNIAFCSLSSAGRLPITALSIPFHTRLPPELIYTWLLSKYFRLLIQFIVIKYYNYKY